MAELGSKALPAKTEVDLRPVIKRIICTAPKHHTSAEGSHRESLLFL